MHVGVLVTKVLGAGTTAMVLGRILIEAPPAW